MSIRFTLTVTIEGNSLDEIDNGLTEAAGARIQARLLQKQDLTGGLKIKVDTSVATQRDVKEQMVGTATDVQPSLVETPMSLVLPSKEDQPAIDANRVGRKHKTKEKETAAAVAEKPEDTAHSSAPQPSVLTPTEPKVSRAAADQALSRLIEAKGIDAARALLTSFNAKRLPEIAEGTLPEFIRQCDNLV